MKRALVTTFPGLLLALAASASTAAGQDADAPVEPDRPAQGGQGHEPDDDAAEEDGEEPEATPTPAEQPALPAPTLPEVEEPPPEPVDPEAEQPVILQRISRGDHPEWEDDAQGEVPRDVPFQVPDDQRVPSRETQLSNVPQVQVGGADPEEAPRTFELAASAGYARLLGEIPLDFFRLEERFEARVPDFEALHLGVGASQMFGPNGFLLGGGPRAALGAFICDGGWIQCEGVVGIQPGVMAGDVFGVRFDLNAWLDVRFVLERLVVVSVGGGYSLLATNSLFFVNGQVGAVF